MIKFNYDRNGIAEQGEMVEWNEINFSYICMFYIQYQRNTTLLLILFLMNTIKEKYTVWMKWTIRLLVYVSLKCNYLWMPLFDHFDWNSKGKFVPQTVGLMPNMDFLISQLVTARGHWNYRFVAVLQEPILSLIFFLFSDHQWLDLFSCKAESYG